MMDKLWKQITPSDYSTEREVLDFLRAELPNCRTMGLIAPGSISSSLQMTTQSTKSTL